MVIDEFDLFENVIGEEDGCIMFVFFVDDFLDVLDVVGVDFVEWFV